MNLISVINKKKIRVSKYTVCLFAVMFCITSCRIKERLQLGKTAEHIREEALISHILEKQLNFESLYFKRMNIEVNDNGKTVSARANMYIKKDRQIIVQVFVAILEVARISIEPDEIVVIDRFNKNVYYTSFGYISRKFHTELNFDLLQSILTNKLFSYPEGSQQAIKQYAAERGDGMYTLKSADEIHEIDVISDSFKIIRNKISNKTGASVDIRYSNFNALEATMFPCQFSMTGKRENEEFGLTLKFSDIEVNGTATISFKVSDGYGKRVL